TAEKRLHPAQVLSDTRSVIMLGVNYWPGKLPAGGPAWARYALQEDYHDTIKPGLMAAGRVLEEIYGVGSGDYRCYVDTGPVLERSWAARAGLGFIGKNAMLISRRHGNWLLLAAILTRVELAPDAPVRKKIARGSATVAGDACLEVCPWNRFAREGRRLLLAARHDLVELTLSELLALTPVRFATVFKRTAIK